MEECEVVISKHGNGIKNIIPDLNEKSPFLHNTEEQWTAIGTFLANINREMMENGKPNTQTNPVSSEDRRDDEMEQIITEDDTVQPII